MLKNTETLAAVTALKSYKEVFYKKKVCKLLDLSDDMPYWSEFLLVLTKRARNPQFFPNFFPYFLFGSQNQDQKNVLEKIITNKCCSSTSLVCMILSKIFHIYLIKFATNCPFVY